MTPVRVGVLGLGRGMAFAGGAAVTGLDVVALCDAAKDRLDEVGSRLGVATYSRYEDFLAHDMDAVVVANWFHQHAPYAIEALRSGRHVLSETSACFTLAEGVALVEEVERSGLVYMLAENYAYTAVSQELRRRYQEGAIGRLLYGEAEYVHPLSAETFNALAPGEEHWRNWLPFLYYCTHALAPLMHLDGAMPVEVSGFVIPYDHDDPSMTGTARRSDQGGVVIARMDDGAIVKLLQGTMRGESVWVRLHGSRGAMESLREDRAKLRLVREPWDLGGPSSGEPVVEVWEPSFPPPYDGLVEGGHGGSDLFTSLRFAEAVRAGRALDFDVYRAVAMSVVGIQAYRSALEGSVPQPVPDFRDPVERARWAADDWSPDPAHRREGQPWPSVLGDVRPPAAGLDAARAVWGRARSGAVGGAGAGG